MTLATLMFAQSAKALPAINHGAKTSWRSFPWNLNQAREENRRRVGL